MAIILVFWVIWGLDLSLVSPVFGNFWQVWKMKPGPVEAFGEKNRKKRVGRFTDSLIRCQVDKGLKPATVRRLAILLNQSPRDRMPHSVLKGCHFFTISAETSASLSCLRSGLPLKDSTEPPRTGTKHLPRKFSTKPPSLRQGAMSNTWAAPVGQAGSMLGEIM